MGRADKSLALSDLYINNLTELAVELRKLDIRFQILKDELLTVLHNHSQRVLAHFYKEVIVLHLGDCAFLEAVPLCSTQVNLVFHV